MQTNKMTDGRETKRFRAFVYMKRFHNFTRRKNSQNCGISSGTYIYLYNHLSSGNNLAYFVYIFFGWSVKVVQGVHCLTSSDVLQWTFVYHPNTYTHTHAAFPVTIWKHSVGVKFMSVDVCHAGSGASKVSANRVSLAFSKK